VVAHGAPGDEALRDSRPGDRLTVRVEPARTVPVTDAAQRGTAGS
jgi:hypothetical protein